MVVYESRSGRVHASIFMGLRFELANGRIIKATKSGKLISATISKGLTDAGFNPNKNMQASEMLWEYMLDFAQSPPDGIHHQAVMAGGVDDTIAQMIDVLKQS